MQQSPNSLTSVLFAPTRSVFHQLPRALVASALAASVDVGSLLVMVKVLHWPTHALGGHHIGTILATIIAYMLGNIVQYLLSHYWVFADNSANRLLSFIPFTVLALVGLLITTGVVELLYGMFHWDILLAKSCALILAFIWNFTSRRMLIFRQTVLPPTVQKQHIP